MDERKGMNIICTKWIIKEKENEGGRTWKVKLVVKGFIKKFGKNF